MDLNYDILQYYAYKKIIKRRQMKGIYEDCTRLQMPVENYMIAKGYCTQVTAWASFSVCRTAKWVCSSRTESF